MHLKGCAAPYMAAGHTSSQHHSHKGLDLEVWVQPESWKGNVYSAGWAAYKHLLKAPH
jgi:hypothetical protein